MAASDAKYIPVKNVAYRTTFAVRNTDGEMVSGVTFETSLGGGSGKVRVSKDGGSQANSTNSVSEIGGGLYFLDLTSTEMNADTVAIQARVTDPSITDTSIILNPEPRGLRDLAFPAVSGRSLAVDASGQVTVGAFAAGVITAAAIAADAFQTAKFQDGVFTAPKFADNFLTAAKIATDAIDNDALALSAVLEITANLWAQTMSEPSGVPAVNGTLKAAIEFLFVMARNKRTQTTTTEVLRNDADSATIATSTKSDDGTTFTRGEFS